MAEYHVGCGVFGIYAGTLDSRNKAMWRDKSECTDEALNAVRDYLFKEFINGENNTGGYEWTMADGRIIELRVTVRGKKDEQSAETSNG